MKSILIHLEEDEYEKVMKKKGDKSWKEYLIQNGGGDEGDKKD